MLYDILDIYSIIKKTLNNLLIWKINDMSSNKDSRPSSSRFWQWAACEKPYSSRAQTRLCVLHHRFNWRAFDNEISLQTRRDEAQHLAATITDILYPGFASPRFLHNAVAERNTFGCYAVHPVTDNDPCTFLGYTTLPSLSPSPTPLLYFSLSLTLPPSLAAVITPICRMRRIKCDKQIFLQILIM